MTGLNGYLLFWILVGIAIGFVASWLLGSWIVAICLVVAIAVFARWPVDVSK